MTMTMYRQGDVLIIRTNTKPSGTEIKRDKDRIVLAYGEVTGHAHAILERDAVLWDNGKGVRILAAKEPLKLQHEEHATIVIPPGNYRVIQQREYSPEAIRNVQD